MEEPVRRARQERWQAFLPATRRVLSRLEALAGARLAEELAEAIQGERTRPTVPADLAMERVTEAAFKEREEARQP